MKRKLTSLTFLLTILYMSLAFAAHNNAAFTGGNGHTCAVTSLGGVKCWGLNNNGQLGDNSTTSRLTPVDVSGLTSGVTAIATGSYHTCALTTSGGVKCWGLNDNGQLGDSSNTRRLTPSEVSGLSSGVAAIATGSYHTCALTTSGSVKCWGLNDNGQLGNNSNTPRLTPGDVWGLTSGVTAIATGSYHTCALTTSGSVKCWGLNDNGQLGDNANTRRSVPAEVSGLSSGVEAIAAGTSHTCALTTTGGVKCWGLNDNGQLGDNSNTRRLTPAVVSGLSSGVEAIATGSYHTCALTTPGGVKCWGLNQNGQLGDNSNTRRLFPGDVSGLTNGVEAIAAGSYHTCALTTLGSLKCWGLNDNGQLGDYTNTQRLTPANVLGLTIGGVRLTFAAGWNLAGNSIQAPITVASTFNDSAKVASVWKWVTSGITAGLTYPTWAYYSPEQVDHGQAYAASKGYDFITMISAGEGFWINANVPFTVRLTLGTAVASSSLQNMSSGWHLVSTGTTETPSSFNTGLSTSSPPAGIVPTNIKSLWVWDNSQSKWYFYAPGLEAKGGTALSDFITANGYLNFTTAGKTLGAGIGFWVNRP